MPEGKRYLVQGFAITIQARVDFFLVVVNFVEGSIHRLLQLCESLFRGGRIWHQSETGPQETLRRENTVCYGIPRILQQLDTTINITDGIREVCFLIQPLVFLLYGLHRSLEGVRADDYEDEEVLCVVVQAVLVACGGGAASFNVT